MPENEESFEYEDDEVTDSLPKKVLILNLESCGLAEKDQRRMNQYHGLICSHPGKDIFGFRLPWKEGGWRVVTFPNVPIEITDDLLDQLAEGFGEENLRCLDYATCFDKR